MATEVGSLAHAIASVEPARRSLSKRNVGGRLIKSRPKTH